MTTQVTRPYAPAAIGRSCVLGSPSGTPLPQASSVILRSFFLRHHLCIFIYVSIREAKTLYPFYKKKKHAYGRASLLSETYEYFEFLSYLGVGIRSLQNFNDLWSYMLMSELRWRVRRCRYGLDLQSHWAQIFTSDLMWNLYLPRGNNVLPMPCSVATGIRLCRNHNTYLHIRS